MKDKNNPIAFISHASEDKSRFVEGFATKLRQNGVDAWFDRWEIQPGDSLVEKIFDQGIGKAEIFIIVLSSNSVGKAWVREELDSGVVRHINKNCRIIPVVIDDCEVPTALKHLKWQTISNLENWEAEFQQILNAIVGGSEKPPLGKLPPLATRPVINFSPRLSTTDNLIFEIFGDRYLATGKEGLEVEKEFAEFENLGLSREEVSESLEMLGSEHLFEVHFGPNLKSGKYEVVLARIKQNALSKFARKKFPDYEQMLLDLISAIANKGAEMRDDIMAEVTIPEMLAEIMVHELDSQNLIHVVYESNGQFHCIRPKSPRLKRMLG